MEYMHIKDLVPSVAPGKWSVKVLGKDFGAGATVYGVYSLTPYLCAEEGGKRRVERRASGMLR